jgi:tetratricopeptide (TPR) repeat protein
MPQNSVVNPPTPPNRRWGLKLVIAFIVLVVGGSFGRYLLTQYHYNQGTRAYKQGDCSTAIDHFKNITTGNRTDDLTARARAKKAECEMFQTATRQQPESAALVAYTQFATRYPASVLVRFTRGRTSDLFQQVPLSNLAQPQVCNQIERMAAAQLIPEPKAAPFFHACGQTYAANQNFANAIALYEQFLDRYPKHTLAATVKTELAQTYVADAMAKGALHIPPPGRSGNTNDGSTVVRIQNDSREPMRIVFSGPTPRFEELAPCENCRDYIGSGPTSCPAKGPVGQYTLTPGEYAVVVKSGGDRSVKPFSGNWTLANGTEYSHCFFIVRRI